MITRTKIKQLENKYTLVSHRGNNGLVVRKINVDHKLIDRKGNLLMDSEVKRIEIENEAIRDAGSTVVFLTSYRPI